jgi:hypothetical protein
MNTQNTPEYVCYTCGFPSTRPECESCALATLAEQITSDPRELYETEEREELEF